MVFRRRERAVFNNDEARTVRLRITSEHVSVY